MERTKKEGLNEVWGEMGEVSCECNCPKHFSDNQIILFYFFLIQLIFSPHGPWAGVSPTLAQGRACVHFGSYQLDVVHAYILISLFIPNRCGTL